MQDTSPSIDEPEKSEKPRSRLLRRAAIGCVVLVGGCFLLSMIATTIGVVTSDVSDPRGARQLCW